MLNPSTIQSLPVLILNPHSRCNCRCKMCDIWKTTEAHEIRASDLKRQMKSIEQLQVQWVVLSGGEALMHSELWKLTAMLHTRDIRITLLSSGLLLARYAECIIRFIDDVIVSLDGPREVHDSIRRVPGAYDALSSGIFRLRELDSRYPVSARCTVQRSNFACLRATADAARRLKLNSISFLAADVDSTAFHRPDGWPIEKKAAILPEPADLKQLESGVEELIESGDCGGFIMESPPKLRKIVQHFRAVHGAGGFLAPRCNAPWKSAVVEADGAVRPCFFHRPIGHLSSGQTLEQILNGPEAIAFRASLDVETNPICQRCVCSLHWKPNE